MASFTDNQEINIFFSLLIYIPLFLFLLNYIKFTTIHYNYSSNNTWRIILLATSFFLAAFYLAASIWGNDNFDDLGIESKILGWIWFFLTFIFILFIIIFLICYKRNDSENYPISLKILSSPIFNLPIKIIFFLIFTIFPIIIFKNRFQISGIDTAFFIILVLFGLFITEKNLSFDNINLKKKSFYSYLLFILILFLYLQAFIKLNTLKGEISNSNNQINQI